MGFVTEIDRPNAYVKAEYAVNGYVVRYQLRADRDRLAPWHVICPERGTLRQFRTTFDAIGYARSLPTL